MVTVTVTRDRDRDRDQVSCDHDYGKDQNHAKIQDFCQIFAVFPKKSRLIDELKVILTILVFRKVFQKPY